MIYAKEKSDFTDNYQYGKKMCTSVSKGLHLFAACVLRTSPYTSLKLSSLICKMRRLNLGRSMVSDQKLYLRWKPRWKCKRYFKNQSLGEEETLEVQSGTKSLRYSPSLLTTARLDGTCRTRRNGGLKEEKLGRHQHQNQGNAAFLQSSGNVFEMMLIPKKKCSFPWNSSHLRMPAE